MKGWKRTTLGESCEIVSGATPSTSVDDYWDGDVFWATPKDLSDLDGTRISVTARRITEAGLASCSATILPPGSVLFSSRAPIGHVAINTVPMATNQGFKSFIPKPDRLHAPYLYWWLRTKRRYLESLGNGATFKEVSKAIVAGVAIPMPPLLEQRRLAEILDQADALRAKRRAALAQVGGLTQAIFLEMFGDPLENPRGFPVRPLIDIVDPGRPISYGILMPGPEDSSGILYVRVVDMKDGSIDVTGVRKTSRAISDAYRRSLLKAGDLLLSIRGHVGRLAVVPSILHGANITQDTARLALRGADPLFVLECLRSASAQRWMARHVKGVAVTGINLGDVKRIPVISPPQEDQRSFASRAAAVDKLKAAHRASLAQLDALFASLQHRAFRAEL